MNKSQKIDLLQKKIEQTSEKFYLFINGNKIDKEDEIYILKYLEEYTKEVYFIKSLLFIQYNINKEPFNENNFNDRIVEINNFINGINKIID